MAVDRLSSAGRLLPCLHLVLVFSGWQCRIFGAAELADKSEFCPDWAASGECGNNPEYMMQECPSSCAGKEALPAAAETVSAEQQTAFCVQWAANGECQNNPAFMLQECSEFCGRVPATPEISKQVLQQLNGLRQGMLPAEASPGVRAEPLTFAAPSSPLTTEELRAQLDAAGDAIAEANKIAAYVPTDPVERYELAESRLEQTRQDFHEFRKKSQMANRVSLEEVKRAMEEKAGQLTTALEAATKREKTLSESVSVPAARIAKLEALLASAKESLAAATAAGPRPRPRHSSKPLPSYAQKRPGVVLTVVPEANETACEEALQKLCSGNLDGQQPELKDVQVACSHALDELPKAGSPEPEAPEVADSCPSVPPCPPVPSYSSTSGDEENLCTLSVFCHNDAGDAGVLLAALRSVARQSAQLLMEATLLGVSGVLGADSAKGRIAAAKAWKIALVARDKMFARAVQRFQELRATYELEVPIEAIAAAEQARAWARPQAEEARALLEDLLRAASDALPSEYAEWLPRKDEDASDADHLLKDRLLMLTWLLLFCLLAARIALLSVKWTLCLLFLPFRILYRSASCFCRCFCRRLCPCKRKPLPENLVSSAPEDVSSLRAGPGQEPVAKASAEAVSALPNASAKASGTGEAPALHVADGPDRGVHFFIGDEREEHFEERAEPTARHPESFDL